ncbi:hypothetical protein HDU67_004472 [Dinochytrium kinnereticum]|nr:hypothetical protein HDU67_004472 [Dinochytrium kinnereticum]
MNMGDDFEDEIFQSYPDNELLMHAFELEAAFKSNHDQQSTSGKRKQYQSINEALTALKRDAEFSLSSINLDSLSNEEKEQLVGAMSKEKMALSDKIMDMGATSNTAQEHSKLRLETRRRSLVNDISELERHLSQQQNVQAATSLDQK